MCSLIPMIPQVSFLNICICWTIAYFFKSPPHPSLKAERYIWFMCIVYKAKRKKEKKAKKYCERKKKQLNIFWINIWYFF